MNYSFPGDGGVVRFFLSAPICVALILVTTGCGGLDYVAAELTESTRDVSNNPKYWVGFRVGSEYVLLRTFFIVEYKDWSRRLMLARTKGMPGIPEGSMPSIEEYRNHPNKWPEILGVVEEGTHLRCNKLLSHGAPGWGRALFPFAEIPHGSYKGKTVDIGSVGKIIRNPKAPAGELFQVTGRKVFD